MSNTCNFVIAIPSYRRSDIIGKLTLAYLKNVAHVNLSNVYVFIVEEEESSYKTTITDGYDGVHLVTGPLGLHNMRNFITDYFEEGTHILQMDDDISNIVKLHIDETVVDLSKASRYKLIDLQSSCATSNSVSASEFTKWIHTAFDILVEKGLTLFGIYPVKNGFFMKDLPDITYDLRFCVGVLWGCINVKSLPRLTLEEKEDFERTLIHWSNNVNSGVLRFNHITAATKYYKTEGGMQARGIDRKVASKTSCYDLCSRFPNVCRIYLGKKNGMTEVRLRVPK